MTPISTFATAVLAVTLACAAEASVGNPLIVPIDGPVSSTAANSGRVSPLIVPSHAGALNLYDVQVNDPSQTPAGATDYLPAVAAIGDKVLIVWFVHGTTATQRLRAAISLNGGVTFTDVDWLPALPGDWRWGPDPCVASDPVTNTFFVMAQAASPATSQAGIAFVTAQIDFGISWGTPSIPRLTTYAGVYYGNSLDIHYDATYASLDVAFRDGWSSPATLTHQVSWDRGATWSSPTTLLTDPTGFAGINPCVAWNGFLGPIVTSIDLTSWEHATLNSRRSTGSFNPPVTMATYRYDGASLPGTLYDFINGVSIASDRTIYRYQGKLYAAWVASCGFPTWPVPSGFSMGETEPNDQPNQANVITGAGWMSGTLSPTTESDYLKLPLTQNQRLVVRATSIVSAGTPFSEPTLMVEVIAPDGLNGLGNTELPLDHLADATMLYTAPLTSTYYLRVSGINVQSYQISLSFSSTANPGVDRKDLWFSVSGDAGNSWSTPSMFGFVQSPGHDAANVRLLVANDGRPYVFWQDWSENLIGYVMSVRASRSSDGGYSWEAPHTISSAYTDWQSVTPGGSNFEVGWQLGAATTPIVLGETPRSASAPGAQAPRGPRESTPEFAPKSTLLQLPQNRVHVAWTDGRLTQSDIFTNNFQTGFDVVYVTNDTTATPGEFLGLGMALVNWNSIFDQAVNTTVPTCNRNWSSEYSSFSIPPSQSLSTNPYVVEVPDTAAAGTVFFQGAIDIGPESFGVNTFIHVLSNVGVGGEPMALEFRSPAPNPASHYTNFGFRLPAADEVTLEVFDVRGARVRTLLTGHRGSGSHARGWDLCDDAGHRVPGGIYLARLTVGDRRLMKRVAVVN